MIDPEEFAAWREHPVTKWMLEAMALNADEIKQTYIHRYFHNIPSEADISQMNYERGQFDAFQSIASITHGELTAIYAATDE